MFELLPDHEICHNFDITYTAAACSYSQDTARLWYWKSIGWKSIGHTEE